MFKDKRRYILFKICFELKTNSYFEKGWRSLKVLIEIQYKKCQEIKVSDFRGSFSYHSALRKYFQFEKLVFLSKVCFWINIGWKQKKLLIWIWNINHTQFKNFMVFEHCASVPLLLWTCVDIKKMYQSIISLIEICRGTNQFKI